MTNNKTNPSDVRAFEKVFTKHFSVLSLHRKACEEIWQTAYNARPEPTKGDELAKITIKEIEDMEVEYKEPNSTIDSGNLYWMLGKAKAALNAYINGR